MRSGSCSIQAWERDERFRDGAPFGVVHNSYLQHNTRSKWSSKVILWFLKCNNALCDQLHQSRHDLGCVGARARQAEQQIVALSKGSNGGPMDRIFPGSISDSGWQLVMRLQGRLCSSLNAVARSSRSIYIGRLKYK